MYEYKCVECHHKFEKYVRVVTDRPSVCPKCQHTAFLVVSTFGAILWKGGHWNKGA